MICVTCGEPIDDHAFATKARIAEKLFPGHPLPPPKRCSMCTWEALLELACTKETEEGFSGESVLATSEGPSE